MNLFGQLALGLIPNSNELLKTTFFIKKILKKFLKVKIALQFFTVVQ